jgi:hypothetical protein
MCAGGTELAKRVVFICLGAALLLGFVGVTVAERRDSSSATGVARHGRKALPPGLAKQRAGRLLPPGLAKPRANHGHCVSRWAHEATEQGLRGRAHGRFVSSVAEDHAAVGTDCDKEAELDAALRAVSD